MSNRASVLQPGLQTTVQDYPGRVGHWRVGIPPSGPMDSLAFRLANLLVGNSPGAAALEMQFTGPTLRFETAATIALTGGDCGATLAGAAVPHWRSLDVAAGQELRCPALRSGARAYLAIRGGIEKDPVLGSRATFPRGGVGGEALAAGASLGWPDTDRPRHGWRVAPGRIPAYASEIEVALTDGPHVDWLDEAGRATFLGAAWKVSGQSDRTGVRLIGPKLSFSRQAVDKPPEHGVDPSNVINTGYPIGGINLCGDTPIILPFDGPSQGGFITPYVVASAAMWKIGQARPGQILRFTRVPVDAAIELRFALEAAASAASLEPVADGPAKVI